MIELYCHRLSMAEFEKLRPCMENSHTEDRNGYFYFVGHMKIGTLELTIFTDDIDKETRL